MTPVTKLERVRYSGYLIWSAIGAVVLIAAAAWGFGRIAGALTPFFIALLLAFILRPLVDFLEKRGIARGWGSLAAFLLFVLVWVAASALVFPPIAGQVAGLVEAFPGYVREATAFFTDLGDRYERLQLSEQTQTWVHDAGKELSAWVSTAAKSSGTAILAGASSVFGFVFDLLMSFILTFWILKDSHRMYEEVKVLAGERWADDVEMFSATVSRVLGGYLRGTMITSLCTGTIAFIGFQLIGLPYALILGIITGVLNVIPIVGPWIGGLIAGTVALFVSPMTAVFAGLITIGAQQVVDLTISPRVMSEQVELHPVLVIFALLVGGTLFGIVGTIVAVPVAATVKGVFVYYFERRTKRRLTSEDGALFAGAVDDPSACR